MKIRRLLLLLTASAMVLTSCEDDGLTMDDLDVPEGYLPSAGTATLYWSSPMAYDQPADWVSGSYNQRFNTGDRLYDNAKTSQENGHGGGLGPVYAGYSCGSCHRNAGRTTPTYWTNWRGASASERSSENGVVGSGSTGFTSMLIYVTRRNGTFFPSYGRVIHDQAIYGVQAEGKVSVKIDSMEFAFPDGEKYTLCVPRWSITEWYADSVSPEDLFCTVRIPLRHVGMGQIMALDHHEIEQLAARSNYPEWGISGRANYIKERGVTQLGLSGNKAQHADLTVELGFSSDMGMTNSRYPEEICEGQLQMEEGSMMGLSYAQLDATTEQMENVDLYMQCLAVPARRNVNDPDVQAGEQLFYQAGCHLCHTTTLHTRSRGSTLLAGTTLPWLGGQTIHPYSDFLLHDMGSEIMGVGLNDNYVSGLARGNEWRTTPLWGVGLQEKVNGHTYFLHDGRARNFTEAIMWHGGEGEASKNKFKNMNKTQRDQLIKFLWSL
ncbi:MAG: thiol oxidoreductase [Bacteroidaceae bacterium]|nr:thiol oxidoreductase [Bacteroidaceae bacterium]